MTEKIAIIGAGNAGCISALNLHYLKMTEEYQIGEIEIYHDPNIPIERVGQGRDNPMIQPWLKQALIWAVGGLGFTAEEAVEKLNS